MIAIAANTERLANIGARLEEVVARTPVAPEWAVALFLLSGFHLRMLELNCSSDQMDASVAALMERLLDGGEPV